jgi:hypothetical protein
MSWCDHRQQSRKIPPQAQMRFDDRFLLAGMGRSGRNDRPTVDRILQFRKRPGSAGGAGASSLRLPVVTTFDAPRSLRRKASDEVPARQRSRRRRRSAMERGARRQR